MMALGAARAGAQSTQTNAAPQLQVSQLIGKIEVETPNQTESVAGQTLPYIRSGSIVRVLSGSAAFESDTHATVRAGKGDSFHFAARRPESGQPGVIRIAAVGKEPKTLEVNVGGLEFFLRKGSDVSLTASGRGEMTVKIEQGNVHIKPGSVPKNSSLRPNARMMAAGESVIVRVPEEMRFESAALSRPAVKVSRENDTTFVAQADWPARPSNLNRDAEARRTISRWPEVSRTVALATMEKYGAPDQVHADKLVWNNNGAWDRTIAYRDLRDQSDILEQTIRYEVPRTKLSAVNEINLPLRVSRDRKEISATSESEQMNFLALNLADEVIKGKKSSVEARDFYARTVSLSKAGKTSPYMQGLLFTLP
ncbi:MAG TPA: hypothetical protein DEB40_05860 [Elusimicrobia bacterium]|nr:hypothetical protein [Elusimicrobiota bacterium]HBT61251.1 hypothetical protein [Elusimicrobiota bacterium]